MASCDLTAGRLRPCKDALGGLKTVYLYNELEDSFTVVAGEATAMNVALTDAFKYELEGDLNTLEENMPSDRNTFARVNTQTITLVVKVPDANTNAQFNLLVAGFSHAVVEDRNGNFSAVGLDDGIDWTVVRTSGGAKADGSFYTLTGVSTTNEIAPILDSATETAFLAIVALV